ncbi:hypothetical protein NNJEOMEG_01552 [Fundidesulfovibrio magnetotacticus]|uniref:Spore protein YkvP/CgeB glycosyl transferase-like domain-containing protein n=1 Tax=Fundidesulfovibrio magnetotacticus TaxID=2730080 RepID=A0A6V8LTR8_9BACT|nr:glycosyltransferase [Fundidesulfovibrio magnetotacticus]GFK93718.1 hypothetical protein NNJEOMEG_01552 [Fundidesulfovibrio magnetotacticus]
MNPARPLAVWITPQLPGALGAFPAAVRGLEVPPGIVDVAALLEREGLEPDLLLQDERLAPRTLLQGLERLDCPKVFWSLDPHLNHHWQAPYAALFDAVAATQKHWAGLLGAEKARKDWVTWSAPPAPWIPHAERPHRTAFVGRVTGHRPVRAGFVKHLRERWSAFVHGDLPHAEVLPAYCSARVAPGESIQGEITQRLFLSASAGCAVVDPLIDNGLEDLFEPDREVLTYSHVLELDEALARLEADPALAERLGRAARERHAREHLPERRVEALGRLALAAERVAPAGAEARRLFWLSAARCTESGHLPAPRDEVLEGVGGYGGDPECLAALGALLALAGRAREALGPCLRLLSGPGAGHAGLAACACALALRLGEAETAAGAYALFARASGEPPLESRTPAGICRGMSGALARRGALWRPGFAFDPERHLAASAVEFLHLAHALDPRDLETCRRIEALLRGLPGSDLVRVAHLSTLTLHRPKDYRLGAALGLADLKAFRAREGLEELRLARLRALEQGRLPAFEGFLRAADPGGSVERALAWTG